MRPHYKNVSNNPSPTNNGIPVALPPSSCPPEILPPRRHRALSLSALSIARGAVMDWHAASTPSQSDAVSATPACTHLVGGWARGTSAAIAAAAMPQPPIQGGGGGGCEMCVCECVCVQATRFQGVVL